MGRRADFDFEKKDTIKATFKIDPPTVNYELLIRKPKINHVELDGDKSLEDLGIVDKIDELIEAHNENDEVHPYIQERIDTVEEDLATEKRDRELADNTLDGKITNESIQREIADDLLGRRIDKETAERKAADQALDDKIEQLVKTDKHYTFEQAVPAKIWVINHGLNKKPSVTIVDSAESVVSPDEIIYSNLNTIVITFLAAFAGRAYCN